MAKLQNTVNFLLDIDGTLVNSDGIYFEVFTQLLTPHGHNVTPEWYEANVHGKTDAQVFTALMPEADLKTISKQKDDLFVKLYNEHVAKHGVPMIAGLDVALTLAEQLGVRACAVTNAPRGAAEACIASIKAAIPAARIIEGLIIGAECERAKPSPDPYIAGMALLDVPPSACIVFEDSRAGARAGVAAHCHVVGIRSNLDDAALKAVGAHLTIENWHELSTDCLNALIEMPRSAQDPKLIATTPSTPSVLVS